MQMLYRLSYVGAINRNIQAGKHCSVLQRTVGVLHQILKTWPSDLGGRDTIARPGSRIAEAVG
jgi:hypothetical protein